MAQSKSVLRKTILCCAVLALNTPASARGFCNVDHVGNHDQQDRAKQAAASFYKGMGYLSDMLAAYELSKPDDISGKASAATASFEEAASGYFHLAKSFDGTTFFATVDFDMVRQLAQATSKSAYFASVEQQARDTGASGLLQGCAEKAEDLSKAAQGFPNQIGGGTSTSVPFSDLLVRISIALDYGRIVSATFANAGGEIPKK